MQSHFGTAVEASDGGPVCEKGGKKGFSYRKVVVVFLFFFLVFSNLAFFLSLGIVTCVHVVIIIFAFSSVQTLIYGVVYY